MILPLTPILIPFITGLFLLAFRGFKNAQRIGGVVGSAGLLLSSLLLLAKARSSGIQVIQLGNWQAPFGISVVVDLFSAYMIVLTGIMALLVSIYSLAEVPASRARFGYYPFLQFLLMGVCGTFSTGDLFNLYVWFEVMLMSSFALLTLGGKRPQLEGAIKYVTLNLVSSVMFLTAVGILYAVTGTLNMADLAVHIRSHVSPGLVTTVSMLFLVAFGIKAAVFPLFFWLPASYHTPPVAVTALFSGLLTKVGVYSLIRVFTLLFHQDVGYTHGLILAFGGLTMVTGVLGAVAQNEMRRLLSFHIVSQIGYLLMGLGLFTPLAMAGALYFMAHVIFAKSALFLVSGIAEHLQGTYQLKKLGGLYRSHPMIALLFLLAAFSLAGLPPLSGFFAKYTLVRAGLETGHYLIVIVALAVGLLTLFSMMKIWNQAFWKPSPQGSPDSQESHHKKLGWKWVAPTAVLAGLTLLMGLVAEPVFKISSEAAAQLLNPSIYIQSVLGGSL